MKKLINLVAGAILATSATTATVACGHDIVYMDGIPQLQSLSWSDYEKYLTYARLPKYTNFVDGKADLENMDTGDIAAYFNSLSAHNSAFVGKDFYNIDSSNIPEDNHETYLVSDDNNDVTSEITYIDDNETPNSSNLFAASSSEVSNEEDQLFYVIDSSRDFPYDSLTQTAWNELDKNLQLNSADNPTPFAFAFLVTRHHNGELREYVFWISIAKDNKSTFKY